MSANEQVFIRSIRRSLRNNVITEEEDILTSKNGKTREKHYRREIPLRRTKKRVSFAELPISISTPIDRMPTPYVFTRKNRKHKKKS